ncbi:MAG: PAS domain-containing sensor histidine kinase, partial [Myxococcales bacterium]|nr:PAS domain-containing sensor histidine kinase [Myxococcales bacterium]
RSMDGFSQAVLEDHADSLRPEGAQHLRFIRESAQHMARLIDDLLALSRVSRSDFRPGPVNLSTLAEKAIARLRVQAPERRVEVVIAPGMTDRGDATLLTTALDNLLGNAWKFTSKTPHARIEFTAEGPPEARTYIVRDNGAGFDMAYANKLFGVFNRLHLAAEFEGTGIGLASVQRIVRRHGGDVWAEGTIGKGACFYFTLRSDEEQSA